MNQLSKAVRSLIGFRHLAVATSLAMAVAIGGCMRPHAPEGNIPRPEIGPQEQPTWGDALQLDASQVKPMYAEIMAIDLPTVVKVAMADNFDIQRAQQLVEASRGKYEAAIGGAFPAIVPTAVFEHVEGSVRATEGNIVGVGFSTFQPSIAIQWVVNPGKVLYELVAAKKRMTASEHREEAVVVETLRRASVQYYAMALAQSRVAAADQGVTEAEELLRINKLRTRTGTGVPADEMRAEARLAERQQDLVISLNLFYEASVSLAVTLHLDASVTLIPAAESIPPVQLVRDDLPIEEMLGIAVAFRPDLKSIRELVDAAEAKRGGTWWSGFGPTLALSYQYGGITGNANNVVGNEGVPSNLIVNPGSANGSFSSNPLTNGLIREGLGRGSRRGSDNQTFSFSDQQRATASVGWRLTLATFGELKTAKAVERGAIIELEQLLDEVKAQVVTAAQAGIAHRQLIDLSRRQVTSAEEALRLSQANLRAGAMTTLDVLQAQDAATQARLRYAEAVVRYNQSQVNLVAALGLLDANAAVAEDATAAPDPSDG